MKAILGIARPLLVGARVGCGGWLGPLALATMEWVEVSAGIGAMIVQVASRRGVSPAELQAVTGFDVRLGTDPDARIPLSLETALWDEAARRSSDPAFGLHAAEAVRPGMFDVLDYAVRTAPSLRSALERLIRYNRLLHDVARFHLVNLGDDVRLVHGLPPDVTQSRHAAEFTLACVVVMGRQLLGGRFAPRGVTFRHPAPEAAALVEHRRLFGTSPHFAQEENALELPQGELDRTLPAADPALSRVVLRHAEALLAVRPEPSATTSQRVRRLLADTVGQGETTLAAAAQTLQLSERSLQRRLAEEGTTFDGVLDDLRRELAHRYLSDRRIAIAEIAYLLGYSEPSAFHRAFKRWTGRTPREAREDVA